MAFSESSVRCSSNSGTSNYISLGNIAAYNFTSTSTFSIGFWIRIAHSTSGTYRSIISKKGVSPVYGWDLSIDNTDRFFFQFVGATNSILVYSNVAPINYQWMHCICTYNGSNASSGVKFYINGVDATGTGSGTVVGTHSTTTIASICSLSGTRSYLYNASIDDVFIYNRVLSAAEATTIYNSGTPNDLRVSVPSGLIGYWLMGDGDTYPTILDKSATAANGTMTGFSTSSIFIDAPRPITSVYPLPETSLYANTLYPPDSESNALTFDVTAITAITTFFPPDSESQVFGNQVSNLAPIINFPPDSELTTTPVSVSNIAGIGLSSPDSEINTQAYDSRGTPGSVKYYTMCALASPGPGYLTWQSSPDPDFLGNSAPGAFIGQPYVTSIRVGKSSA